MATRRSRRRVAADLSDSSGSESGNADADYDSGEGQRRANRFGHLSQNGGEASSSTEGSSGSLGGFAGQEATHRDLTPEEVEKLVQLQDLTGIDDLMICRALLESNNWDLEATAREQFDVRDPPSAAAAAAPLSSHDEAPEVRRQNRRESLPLPAQHRVWTGPLRGWSVFLFRILKWGFYWVTLPVFWPARLLYSFTSYFFGWDLEPRRRRRRRSSSSSSSNVLLHSPSDPLEDVRSFRRRFDQLHPGHGLRFYEGTYSGALEEAKRDLKFLVAYLHSPWHQDSDRFCADVLGSDEFVDFLRAQNVLLFGCDVETREGYRVSQAVRVNAYPTLAVIVLRQNKMMIVGRQEGHCDAGCLVRRLEAIVGDNEAFVVAARAERAERQMNQTIRQEQDAAFQETLRQDQEKERRKREAEEAKRREQEELEAQTRSAEERKNRIQRAKVELCSMVPSEPLAADPKAVRVVIKLPQGQRLERRFSKADSLKCLFYYVFCHPDSPDHFDITTNFPRKVVPCTPINFFRDIGIDDEDGGTGGEEEPRSFEEEGMGQSTMLFVTDLEA